MRSNGSASAARSYGGTSETRFRPANSTPIDSGSIASPIATRAPRSQLFGFNFRRSASASISEGDSPASNSQPVTPAIISAASGVVAASPAKRTPSNRERKLITPMQTARAAISLGVFTSPSPSGAQYRVVAPPMCLTAVL